MSQTLKLDIIVDDHGGVKVLQDLRAQVDKVATATTTATTAGGGLTSWLGAATPLLRMFGITLTGVAAVNLAKSLLNDADALTKLHDKTGLSIEALQQFRAVAADSGTTIDAIALSVNQMQNRLAGGDASAVEALERLGLSLSDLQRQAPAQQFRSIADAIRAVHDPAVQVQDAMDLFGRSGAEILPAIKQGFDDVGASAIGMSADAVKALDDTGDAIGRLWQRTKSLIGEGVGVVLNRLMADYRSLKVLNGEGAIEADIFASAQARAAAILPSVAAGARDLTLSIEEQTAIEKSLNSQLAIHAAALEEIAKQDKIVADAIREHWTDVGAILDEVLGVNAIKTATNWMDAIDALGGSITRLAVQDLAELETAMLAGIDAMARSGTLTDEQSSRFVTLAIQAHQLAESHGVLSVAIDQSGQKLQEAAAAENDAYLARLKSNDALAKQPGLYDAATEAISRYNFSLALGAVAQSDLLRPQSNLRPDTQSQIMAGPRLSTALTFFNPGNSAGVPVFERGGPTRRGMAMLHDDEFVVPKGGALVKSGGSGATFAAGAIVINYPVMNDPRAMDELGRMIDAAVSHRLSGAL